MRNIRMGLIAGCLSLLPMAASCQAIAQDYPGPEAVTSGFYTWYLMRFADDSQPEPVSDPGMGMYVDTKLLAKIRAEQASYDALDEDYFVKNQDYFDSWLDHLVVKRVAGNDASAEEKVIMGEGAETVILAVKLLKRDAGWRIVEVIGKTPDH